MMNKPTQEQIEKLPKWAQEYIRDVERQRETAVLALNTYCDEQTPAPLHVEELECTGEERGPSFKTRYIQGRRIAATWQGVNLYIYLADDCIELKWEGQRRSLDECAFIPYSFQAARIKAIAGAKSE